MSLLARDRPPQEGTRMFLNILGVGNLGLITPALSLPLLILSAGLFRGPV
jgi:hypothetical protein